MQKLAQGQLRYSPTDIVRFLESPFASWMGRLYLEFPDRVVPDEDSEELQLIAAEGNRHEERYLAQLQEQGRPITEINRSTTSREETAEAITRGDEIVFQAHLTFGRFGGFADFLVLGDDTMNTYEVWDTIQLQTVRVANEGRQDKADLLYTYLTGSEFQQQVDTIASYTKAMLCELETEKRSFQRVWKKRKTPSKQISVKCSEPLRLVTPSLRATFSSLLRKG
jgi:hypothetical protein